MMTRKQRINPRDKGGDHRILNHLLDKIEKPKHDTEKGENRTKTHWRKAKRGYSVDQLFEHGWKWSKT